MNTYEMTADMTEHSLLGNYDDDCPSNMGRLSLKAKNVKT